MTQYIKKLPAVFQTVTEKKFFDATFDQVFTKKDSDYLAGYLGRRNPGEYNPISDFYIPEPSKNRTWWQLEATAYARNDDTTRSNIFFYEDMLDRIKYYGGNILNQDRLFESEYYSFGPPIDYDMFINYQNYYWVEDGLATITITLPSTVTDVDAYIAANIIGKSSYTTPADATPANFTFTTGITVSFTGSTLYLANHTVENMGNCIGIKLVERSSDISAGTTYEAVPWNGTITLSNGRVISGANWDANSWVMQSQPSSGDYITIERGSVDRNAWSRTNKWFHIGAISATISATGTGFPTSSTRALRPIIQFIADLQLFNAGTQYRDTISYGLRDNDLNLPILLSALDGQSVAYINATYSIDLSDGKLVGFFNDTTNIYSGNLVNQYIFETSVSSGGIVSFTPKTSFSTPVVDGDIIFIGSDAPYDGAQRGQTWYYSNGVWSEVYNDKVASNQPPLFQLYDHNGIKLNDSNTYPNSTFAGSEVFSYKVNTTPGATTDPVLKFPIVYTSLGQSTDIVFQNDIITSRYNYKISASSTTLLPIDGYYYYKTSNSDVLYNSWNLYQPCPCNTTQTCQSTSKQRVIDKYTVGYGTQYMFKVSVTPYSYTDGNFIVSVNGIEVNSSSYSVSTISGNLYVDLTTYLTALLSDTQSQPPVVEIQTYTHELLDPASTGYFEIPQQLEANPDQQEVSELSGSDLTQHFASIIANQEGIVGSAFGGNNNYRDTEKNRSLGTYILQNVAPALKSMLVSSSNDLDFISSIRFSQDEYTKFKNRYLSTALQLINQEFNPTLYHNHTVDIATWVDQILKTVNVSKEFSNAFAYSYMVASGTPTSSESKTVPGNSLVTLTNYIDLTDPKNVMYIYDMTDSTVNDGVLLTVGKDYTIVSTNLAIEVQFNLGSADRDFVFYLYKAPLPTYIPSTPSKLGIYPVYLPQITMDYSYVDPALVIIGHDGSKTIAYGDYRDELLLELETRIYNGIQSKFTDQYAVPLRLESVKPGYYRETRYSRQEYLDITESYLNKWCAKNQANYRVNDWLTASSTTPVSDLWKLYNYSDAVNTSAQHLNLPGNWKGIFQYYYDTIFPDTKPWEMLGFSEMPSWWEIEYGAPVINSHGQEVWSSTASGLHYMWADLEAGIIRQGPSAIFDPDTLTPQPQQMWARPGLSTRVPVDNTGEIRSVIDIFGVAVSGDPYAPFDGFDNPWKYGDGAPVEQAWMSTSGYTFNTQEFLYLTRPGPFGELAWDTLGTELSPGTITVAGVDSPVMSNRNWQYVQNGTYSNSDLFFKWMRPKNSDQVVHAESIDGVIQVRFGYQAWISDRILFLGKNVSSTFGQKVRTLNVNLANKFAGFTNKDTTNTYIEAVTPGASTNTLIIPSTDFDVVLHTGQPIKTYSYSGVIIRALGDGTFVVYGYDLLNSSFTVLNRSTAQLIDVSVGGTPAEFQYFTPGATYNQGDIVRYNGVYYTSKTTQTVQKFVSSAWTKLPALPVIGGVSVTYKPMSLESTTTIPYGTVMQTAQEVFDFLIGWGAYLTTQGWVFDNVNQDTNIVDDWYYSAKQFLFWLNTEWAPDASIQLSPLANVATLVVETGYPMDVESMSNGVYSILDKYGVAIAPVDTVTERDGKSITVSPVDLATGGIFYLQVSAAETEHVLIFNNTTSFNDTVYSPLLRARQQRLRFNGFRSNGWYGKMEAPGYLVIADQLVPNYDTIVNSMRYFYDPDVIIDNPSLEDLGRHLIGYESKSYLSNLMVANDVQYLFYQGAIRQKGTSQAFEKLFRSTKVQSNEIIKVYEEWALKLGDFGNTIEQVSTAFRLVPEKNTGEVIVARLNFVPSKIGMVKQINILNAQDVYVYVPRIVVAAPDADPTDPLLTAPLRTARAYAILGTDGRISRIDITDPGYGYLSAPEVTINAGAESSAQDILYAVWQGEIVKDATLDNIINIDIDDTTKWTVRPIDPQYSLEFPLTERITYPTPNAGYVNFKDVDYAYFDQTQLSAAWGSAVLNPVENNTIWIAKTFTEDWDVYKLYNPEQPFSVTADNAGNLILQTPLAYKITPQMSTDGDTTDFGNMLVLQVIEATAVATRGNPGDPTFSLESLELVQVGANYNSVPTVTIDPPPGWTTNVPGLIRAEGVATVAGGVVQSLTLTVPGEGYTTIPNVTISAPKGIDRTQNNIVSFEFTASDADYNYYNLINADGSYITSNDLPTYENYTKLMLFKSMRSLNIPALLPTYMHTGDKFWVDMGINNKWTVYKVTAEPSGLDPYQYSTFRQYEELINSSLFESATAFSTSGTELVQLPVYDPFKNILPGPAKQNITYMLPQDPARYNVTGNTRLFTSNITFGDKQVGQLWWDLSSTRYVYYEQPMAQDGSETEVDNLVYRRDNWASIFPGSTIDIYEWVKSSVPPSQYTGTGTPRDVTTYVQITTANKFTNATETNYYFWVLNTTDKPNIENRTMAALDVSRLLQSPRSQGYSFFAPIQQTATNNSYMFYNIQNILAYKGNNVQVQYRVSQRDDQKHTQWSFFREGDVNSLVTDQYWNKFVDSICGYTTLLPLTDTYTNPIIIQNDYKWYNGVTGWDSTPWVSSPTGMVMPVPDPTLSEEEKYGISYRPRQGMFVDVTSARKVFMQSANTLLKYIPIRDNNPAWGAGLSTWDQLTQTDDFYDTYWTYTNWYAVGYEDVLPNVVYPTINSATTACAAGLIPEGYIVQVTGDTAGDRYTLYASVKVSSSSSVLTLEKVGIENSAIKLLDKVYTDVNVYDLSVELRGLLGTFRTQVMIEDYLVDQNELFFSMLSYVMSEQKEPNWLFKSSYIYIKEDNLPLSQEQLYSTDQISNIINYIIDSKPYHTQIRDYTGTYVNTDIVSGTITEYPNKKISIEFGPGTTVPGVSHILDGQPSGTLPEQFVSGANIIPFSESDAYLKNQVVSYLGDLYRANADIIPGPWNSGNFTPIGEPVIAVTTTPLPPPVFNPALSAFTFTFDGLNLNNPQTAELSVVPVDIIGIQVGSTILTNGVDYYIEYNNDTTYTAYLVSTPATTPVALIWWDAGTLIPALRAHNDESVYVSNSKDDFVINVDTLLPVNMVSGVPYPYAPWGSTETGVDPIVGGIITDFGGVAVYNPATPVTLDYLPVTISFKQNIGIAGNDFYRNGQAQSGILEADLPVSVANTHTSDIVSVSATSDVFPASGAVWINGERIEYLQKISTGPLQWNLLQVTRGTRGTSAAPHTTTIPSLADPLIMVDNPVWIESDSFPTDANDIAWAALTDGAQGQWDIQEWDMELWDDSSDTFVEGWDEELWDYGVLWDTTSFSNVAGVSAGGIWYANTDVAQYLKLSPGTAIP